MKDQPRLPLAAYRKHIVWPWWVVHNCIAHPLVGLLPFAFAFRFHDWTADKKDRRARRERFPA